MKNEYNDDSHYVKIYKQAFDVRKKKNFFTYFYILGIKIIYHILDLRYKCIRIDFLLYL